MPGTVFFSVTMSLDGFIAHRDGIDEAGVRKVIAYVRTLQRANGIE